MTKVCASTPATSSVVAVRPTSGCAAREMPGVGDERGDVERERDDVHLPVRRREIALLGSRGEVRPVDAHDDPAPGAVALRVLRGVADRVLARQLLGDLRVDVRRARRPARGRRRAPGFLRQLPEDELRFLEALAARRRPSSRPQADRVDRRLGPLREIEHLLERQQARRVLAVRQDDDGLPPDLVDVRGDDSLQVLQRDVDRVVHRRRSAGRRPPDRLLELVDVVRERLQDDHAAVEVDDLGQVLRPQPPGEPDRRFLRGRQPRLHAGAGVDQQRQRDRQIRAVEEGDVLLDAVLVDLEVFLLQVGDVARRRLR